MSLEIEEQEKFCPSCQRLKPLSAFNNFKRGKLGKQSYCKKCNIEYQRGKYREALKNYLQYLEERGDRCEMCGVSYPSSVYDFHHVDPRRKEYNVPMLAFRNIDKARAEAIKCALLCANCHRQEHSALTNGVTLFPDEYTTPDGTTPYIERDD